MANAPGGRSQTYLVPGENPLDRHTRTFAAIEIACLDLIGKAIGKPVAMSSAAACATGSASPPTCSISTAAAAAMGDVSREDEYGEVLDARSRACASAGR